MYRITLYLFGHMILILIGFLLISLYNKSIDYWNWGVGSQQVFTLFLIAIVAVFTVGYLKTKEDEQD